MKKRIICIVLTISFVLTLLFYLYSINIDSAIIDYSETYVSNLAVRMLHESINEYLSLKGIDYFDIVSIEKDLEGNAKVITVNSGLLTKIRAETTIILTEKISDLEYKDFYIPIGNIFNSKLFSGQGPKIKIKIVPLGYISSETNNEFISVGINQSKHNISITYNVALKVLAPFSSASIEHSSSVTVAESIIIGEVPNTNITVGSGFSEETRYYVDF